MPMKMHKWSDLKASRYSPEEIRRMKDEALAEIREMDLKALREAAGLTQVEMAAKLESTQSQLSKIEHGGDRRLSTLRRYVEAVGGDLEVTAVIKGKRVRLAGV